MARGRRSAPLAFLPVRRSPTAEQRGYRLMAAFPDDATDLTRLLVVADVNRSRDWYRDILGAEIVGEYGGTSCVIRFVGQWLLLVTGGPPTSDKPTMTFASPANPAVATAELIIAVP